MQTFENNELIDTSMDELAELQKKQDELFQKMTHSTIGKIPKKGETFVLNGLQYNVTFSDPQYGRLHLEIKKP